MKNNRNKGFTLVELIVVLAVIVILAAILVPALLGYIDRSKNQQYILEAKELMTATQAGIVEAYALNKPSFKNAIRNTTYAHATGQYGYFTNYALYSLKKGEAMKAPAADKENGVGAKNIIAKRVIQYANSVDYQFYDKFDNNGQSVSALGKKVGFAVIFDESGKIIYMQYARDGRLVTYDGKSFTAKTGKNLKFEQYRN